MNCCSICLSCSVIILYRPFKTTKRVEKKAVFSRLQHGKFWFLGALSAANVEDRQKIAYKLKKEADALHKYFIDKLETLKGCAISHSEGPLQAVVSVADMYLTSKDMMIVILGALCKNYPDATPTQLERLIGFHEEFRGDAGRNGVKSAFASVPPPKKGEISRATVFSHAELKA